MTDTSLPNLLNKYFTTRQQEADISSLASFPLPDDYRLYLTKYEGYEGDLGPEYLALWGVEELMQANEDYEISSYVTDLLAIGSNMGGELIGMDFKGGGRIVLCPIVGMKAEHYTAIGTSFTDFLIRLDEGREWFT